MTDTNAPRSVTEPAFGQSVSTAMLGAGATTKWKISPNWKDEIEPIEVISETACFVTARIADFTGKKYERRMRKDGREMIFDTFEAAKEALIEDSKQRVRAAEAAWQREKNRLKKRNDIKAPNVQGQGDGQAYLAVDVIADTALKRLP